MADGNDDGVCATRSTTTTGRWPPRSRPAGTATARFRGPAAAALAYNGAGWYADGVLSKAAEYRAGLAAMGLGDRTRRPAVRGAARRAGDDRGRVRHPGERGHRRAGASMVDAARATGWSSPRARAAGGRRSGQMELRRAHCGTSDYAVYQMPPSQCSPPTAPGHVRARGPGHRLPLQRRVDRPAGAPTRASVAGACRRLRPLQPAERSMALVDVREVRRPRGGAGGGGRARGRGRRGWCCAPTPGRPPPRRRPGQRAGRGRHGGDTPDEHVLNDTEHGRAGAGRPAHRLVPAAVDPAAGGRDPADRGGVGSDLPAGQQQAAGTWRPATTADLTGEGAIGSPLDGRPRRPRPGPAAGTCASWPPAPPATPTSRRWRWPWWCGRPCRSTAGRRSTPGRRRSCSSSPTGGFAPVDPSTVASWEAPPGLGQPSAR